MLYGLQQTVAPGVEPVTRGEQKAWMRVSTAYEDDIVEDLITEARLHCEQETERSFITQTWRLTLDRFPTVDDWDPMFEGDVIHLPRPPLIAITSVVYYDPDGVSTTMDTADYQADATRDPGRLAPATGLSWPATQERMGAVVITYTAGYGVSAATVPADLKTAIRLIAGHWFYHREEVGADKTAATQVIPVGAATILGKYAVRRM